MAQGDLATGNLGDSKYPISSRKYEAILLRRLTTSKAVEREERREGGREEEVILFYVFGFF
jgi:hypothetical protein